MRNKFLALLSLVLMLAALLTACSSNPTATPTNPPATPTATPAPPTPTPVPDAKTIAKTAADKIVAVNSLHFLVDIKVGEVVIIPSVSFKRAEGDYLKPDKYQAKLRVAIAIGQVDADTVGYGNEYFLKVGAVSSAWQKLPPDVGFKASVLFDAQNGLGAVAQRSKDLKLVGSATIDGVDCWQLQGVTTGTDIGPLTANSFGTNDVQIEAFVGKSDSLFRQINLKQLSGDPGKAATWQLTFSKFDVPVTISRPAGV